MSPNVASPLTNTPAHTHHPLQRLGSNTHHPNRPTHQASRFRRKPDVRSVEPSPTRNSSFFATALASPLTPPPPLGLLGRRLVSPRLLPLAPRPLQTRRLPSRAHAALPPGILSLRVVVFVSGSWWSVVSRRRFPSSAAASRPTCRTRGRVRTGRKEPGDEDTWQAGGAVIITGPTRPN